MKKIILVVWVVVTLGLAGSTVYLFLENRDLNRQLTETTEEKNKRLVEEINKVFDLPEEDPVVAIVTDKDQFIAQYPVFDNAETGDYLLFFRKARLNVLYRQDEKRVVKTAQVTIPVAIELVGSERAINDAEKVLEELVAGSSVTVKKTVQSGISQSFIYDVDQDQADETSQLADLLDVTSAATLPDTINPDTTTEIIVLLAENPNSVESGESTE